MTSIIDKHRKNHGLGKPAIGANAKKATEHRAPFEEIEERFRNCMLAPLEQAQQIEHADIVIGIPFYNESDTLPDVLKTAIEGIRTYYQDSRAVIVCAGSPAGREALESINLASNLMDNIEHIEFLLEDELLNGKGWGVRAIFEIAERLGADVVLLEADLLSRHENGDTIGLSPEWIRVLMDSIKSGEADMIVSRFDLHYFDALVCGHLAYPLLAAIYNRPIRCLTGGQWGISHHLIRNFLRNSRHAWNTEFSGYGVDVWLATAAITDETRICEAYLGEKIHRRSGGKEDMVLRHLANAFFQEILNDKDWWFDVKAQDSSPTLVKLPAIGIPKVSRVESSEINSHFFALKYQAGFHSYYSLYERIFSQETFNELHNLLQSDTKSFNFPPRLWAEVVYSLLLAHAFGKGFTKGDLLNAIVPLHDGFTASRARRLHELAHKLTGLSSEERDRLLSIESEKEIDELADEFRRQKPLLIVAWDKEAASLEPPVPPVTFREFIPGVQLIVPTELVGRDGNTVTANGIYENIFTQHKLEFESFVFDRLHVSREADSIEITLAIKDFLRSVEDAFIPHSDLSTVEGTNQMVNTIFNIFPRNDSFSLIPEIATEILFKYPPLILLTKLDHPNIASALQQHDPCDVLALAQWTEEREYLEGLWQILTEELRPEHFALSDIKFIVVRHEDFPSLVELRNSTALDKLTSRIVVSNLHKRMGGEYPKLRYFTTIAKDIVEAERFGKIWQQFAEIKRDFGRKVVISIEEHWGQEALSAHNIFEDGNHRILVERIRQMAGRIAADGNQQLADKLTALADSYHLALILPDGQFVTCSAWSWASYSFKGGTASPPPLSIHVERDWASREFLVEYYKAIGGSEYEVEESIIELMSQGKESENLAPILLGTDSEADKMVPATPVVTVPEQPLAVELIRFDGNPILEPIKANSWESKYVLNAGSIRLNGKVYLAYRAFGDDKVSRIGLAISEDGLRFTERLNRPIFEPSAVYDQKGCEDPRLTLIEDRVYMTYIVFDGAIAQIALASIDIESFIDFRWEAWKRHGLVFPGFTNKDAVLFPERFNGKFAMLHRVDPHIWITFSSHLSAPWSRKEHTILAGSTSGMMWDGHKIGAGAQPIKTEYGWLLITHGVDYARVYRLGIMLVDIADPSKLIYRSPNQILEPENDWEVGSDGKSWTANVVFTCGAVPRDKNKEVLGADDEVIVYYGAADSVLCAASVTIGALIPEAFRGGLNDKYTVPAK